MKKMIALLLALTIAMGVTACASNQPADTDTQNPGVETPADTQEPDNADNTGDDAADPDVPATMPDDNLDDSFGQDSEPAGSEISEEERTKLLDLMGKLVDGVTGEMSVMTDVIPADMYEYYAIPAVDGAYAVVSAPMMSSIAHEVVLVEVPEGTDAETVADQMRENMNPRKWVCVEAEETWVKTSGQYVVMVMSAKDMADEIAANFDQVFGA